MSLGLLLITISTFIIFLYLFYTIFTSSQHHLHHPLPPGPRRRWPVVGNLPNMRLIPHQSLAALARKHGPIMYLRLGSVHGVVASSAAMAKEFLKANDGNFSSRPPCSTGKYLAYGYQDIVFRPYGARWRMLRKIFSLHLMSSKALNGLRYIRQEETRALVKELETKRGRPIHLGQLLNECTTNAMSRMALGRGVLSDETVAGIQSRASEFKEMVVEILELAGAFNISDYVPAVRWLDLQGVATRMKKVHVRFDRFVGIIIEEQNLKGRDINGEKQHENMLSRLLSLENDGDNGITRLTDIEMKALFSDLFVAGTDTTSNLVEWCMAELIRHPKILANVQEELDSVVARHRQVTESDLSKLTYLQAVVKETLRLHPPVPLVPRISSQSCEISGYYIPKGTNLLVNIWAIGRDPEVWTDPLEFRPNRFLPGEGRPEMDVSGNDFELIPFGAGRRICPGMNLGMRMGQLLTATLVHAFNWDLADGLAPEELNMEEGFGLTSRKKVPIMVLAKPRLLDSAYGDSKPHES